MKNKIAEFLGESFQDCMAIKAELPYFDIPTKEQMDLLAIGDIVKIGASGQKGIEWFWVEILSIDDNVIEGKVLNVLISITSFKFEDKILFLKKNIREIKSSPPYK